MEDKESVKLFNPTLKRRETILFFFIVVINGLIWIDSDIGLDMCARETECCASVQVVLCNFSL